MISVDDLKIRDGLLDLGLPDTLPQGPEQAEARQPRTVLTVAVLGMLMGLFFCPFPVLLAGETPVAALVCGAVGLAFFTLGGALWLAVRNQRLTAEVSGLCTYRDIWGRQRDFLLADSDRLLIQRLPRTSPRFRLVDEEGAVLVQFEGGMDGAEEIVGVLARRGTRAAFVPPPGQPVVDPDTGRVEWDDRLYGWQHRHRGAIGAGLIAVTLAGCVLPPAAFFLLEDVLKLRWRCLLLGALPLLPMAYYLLFPQVLVWEKPLAATHTWRRMHIHMPIWLLLLTGLPSYLVAEALTGPVVFLDAGRAVALGCALAALMTGLGLWRMPRRLRAADSIMGLVLAAVLLGGLASYHLNFALTRGAQHTPAQIVSQAAPGGDGEPRALTVRLPDGGEQKFSCSEALYRRAAEGKPIVLCVRTSVFGVRTANLHFPEEETS